MKQVKSCYLRQHCLLMLILLLVLACIASPAWAESTTHYIEWLSGSANTTITSNKQVMTTTPTQNYRSEHTLRITLSITGDIPTGQAEFRIPAAIFKDRVGNPIGTFETTTVKAPATGGNTSFHWWLDTATNEIVFTNYAPLPSGYFFFADLKYYVDPYLVPDNYQNTQVKGTLTFTTDAGVTETYFTNALTINYDTRADISALSKSAYQIYDTWPSAWNTAFAATKPANPEDYFYVVWYVRADAGTNDTQPFKLYMGETPLDGGEVIGYSAYASSGLKASTTSGFNTMFNTQPTGYVSDVTVPRTSSTSDATYWDRYIYVRYPKSVLTQTSPGIFTGTVYNTVDATVKGTDSAASSLNKLVSTPINFNQNAPSRPTDGISTAASKSNNGTSYGLINRLESGTKAPWKLVSTNTSPRGSYYFSTSFQGGALTQDAVGTFGVREYTTVMEDSKLYFQTGNNLTGRDYQYNRLYFSGYTEYDLTPTPTSPWATTARTADKHDPVNLTVRVYDPNTNADTWNDNVLGTIEKGLVGGQTRYRFTPLGGTAGTWLTGLDIPLPVHTTGIRLTHTGKAYSVSFGSTYLETELFNSTAVLTATAGKNSLNIYNSVSFTMSGTDAAGNPVTYGPVAKNASHMMTRITTTSVISKSRTEPVNMAADGRYYVDYTTTAYEYITHPETDLQTVINDQILIEQRSVTFYDLLPPGTYPDLSSVAVTGYRNNLVFPTRVEVRDNWKGTGRAMLIVHAQAPTGMQNYYFVPSGTYSTLYSGMVLRFRMYNPWENVFDNGSLLNNYVAYEVVDGIIASGAPDNATGATGSAIPSNLKPAFTDLNADGKSGTGAPNSFLYATVGLNYTPMMSAELGYEKSVASPEDPVFDSSTQVPLAGEYTYRLRMANSISNYTKDVVMYDILETAQGNNLYWRGNLVNVDLSQATRRGIAAKLYYTTQPLTEAALFGDSNHLNNHPEIWTLASANTDLSQATAIAVDLRLLTTNAIKEFAPGETLSVFVKMSAPVDVPQSVIDEQIKAYNAAFISNRKAGPDKIYDTNLSIERSDVATVTLRAPGIVLNKGSNPATGTEWLPTPVHAGETIEYAINVTNTNLAQAIDRIQVTDALPLGLTINTADIRIMFDDNHTNVSAFPNSRASLIISGQQINLLINSLAGREKATLLVPVTVQTVPTNVQTRDFVNKARITSIYDRDFLLESNPTYHRMVMAKVTFQGSKTLIGRDWLSDDVFHFVLTDGHGVEVETVSSQVIQDPQRGFIFTPIAFYQAGNYDFSITEVEGALDSMRYDKRVINIRVSVTENAQGVLTATPSYSVGGQPIAADEVGFTNEYLTTQHTVRKIWEGNGPLPYPEVTVYLYRDGVRYSAITMPPWHTTPPSPDGYTWTWTNLPRLKADGSGELSVYTHREVGIPAHYQMRQLADGTIINTYHPGTFTASKLWNGGMGPSVTFVLYQTVLNDMALTPYRVALDTVILDGVPQTNTTVSGEHMPWTYTWLNLPSGGTIYRPGSTEGELVSFEYEVAEMQVPDGYAIDTYTSASTMVVNVAQYTTRTANKTWEGTAPADQPVMFQLYQAGLPYRDPVPLMPGETQVTWTDLPRFRVWNAADRTQWVEYIYTFEELPLSGYVTRHGEDGWSVTNTRLARVGDYVWFDNNRNGMQDPGERGVPGVTVTILGSKLPANYANTQTTDAGGHYLFSDLPAGEYTITFSGLPAGYELTATGAAGTDAAIDSNGLQATVMLLTEDNFTIDLGLVKTLPMYPAISVPISGIKALSGRALKAGEFGFILHDGAGKEIQTAVNAADGSFRFADRRFSHTGTFIYTVEEVQGNDKAITYDGTKYRVIMHVADEGGQLRARVNVERDGVPTAGGIRFDNHTRLPATGDSGLRLPLVLLLMAIVLGGVVIFLRRGQLKRS